MCTSPKRTPKRTAHAKQLRAALEFLSNFVLVYVFVMCTQVGYFFKTALYCAPGLYSTIERKATGQSLDSSSYNLVGPRCKGSYFIVHALAGTMTYEPGGHEMPARVQ